MVEHLFCDKCHIFYMTFVTGRRVFVEQPVYSKSALVVQAILDAAEEEK